MGELVARVSALGRRYPEEPALKLRVGDLTLDLEPDRVFTPTELCERVWEHPHEYDTKLVEVFIGRLRRTIGGPPLIHTVRHVGYTVREAS